MEKKNRMSDSVFKYFDTDEFHQLSQTILALNGPGDVHVGWITINTCAYKNAVEVMHVYV